MMHGAFHVAVVAGANQAHGDGIVENAGPIDDLVRGAPDGDAESCPAGATGLHVSSLNNKKIPAVTARTVTIHGMSWIGWALLSAAFAAATALLAKVGVEHVDSNLATAIRTTVVVIFAWGIALALGKHGEIRALDRRTMLFLSLSGLATGLSWLCYFRALQLGPASRVAPLDKMSVPLVIVFAWLLMGEKMDAAAIVGGVLITAGAVVMAMS
jgi:transporter family protein